MIPSWTCLYIEFCCVKFCFDTLVALLWGELDQNQWSKITRIMVHQRNRWICDQSGFIGSFDTGYLIWIWTCIWRNHWPYSPQIIILIRLMKEPRTGNFWMTFSLEEKLFMPWAGFEPTLPWLPFGCDHHYTIIALFAMPGPFIFRLCITADMLFAVLQFNLCFRFFLGGLDCYY